MTLSRRAFLELTCAAAATFAACATTTPPMRIESDADVDAILPRLSNWGRWGASDELGTLNLITPQRRAAAANEVHTGETISLARSVSLVTTPGIRRAAYEMMKSEDATRDFIAMVFHGFAMTHYDALCHVFADRERMYNAMPVSAVTEKGATRLGADRVAARGVVGRGVLLDVARVQGAPLEPGTAITQRDLEEAERAEGVRVEEGDILLVRTGAGTKNTRELRAGLHPQCLPWLRERGVALLGGDGDNDVHPLPGFERWASAMHSIGIPHLGLHLLDNAELDVLGDACARERRWSFLFTMAPLRIEGLTGSPVNPLAIL